MGPVLSRRERPEDVAEGNADRLAEIMNKLGLVDDSARDEEQDDASDDYQQNDRDSE